MSDTEGVTSLGQRTNRELTLLLREVGLSHKAIANLALVSKDTVNSWCSGRARIPLDKLEILLAEMKSAGAPPEQLRGTLLDSLLDWGLSSDCLREYFGQDRASVKHGVFVVVAWDLRKAVYRFMGHSLQTHLNQAGCEVALLDCCGNSGTRRLYLGDLVPTWRPAAVISCDVTGFEGHLNDLDEQTLKLARLGIPVVHIQQRAAIPILKNTAYVGWDNYEIGYIGGRIVSSSGNRSVGLLLAEALLSSALRQRGFTQAIKDSGHRHKVQVLRLPLAGDDHTQDLLVKQISAFIQRRRLDAVFAASSGLETAVIRALVSSSPPLVVLVGIRSESSSVTEQLPRDSCHVILLPVAQACEEAAYVALRLGRGLSLSRTERRVLVQCLPHPPVAKMLLSETGGRQGA